MSADRISELGINLEDERIPRVIPSVTIGAWVGIAAGVLSRLDYDLLSKTPMNVVLRSIPVNELLKEISVPSLHMSVSGPEVVGAITCLTAVAGLAAGCILDRRSEVTS